MDMYGSIVPAGHVCMYYYMYYVQNIKRGSSICRRPTEGLLSIEELQWVFYLYKICRRIYNKSFICGKRMEGLLSTKELQKVLYQQKTYRRFSIKGLQIQTTYRKSFPLGRFSVHRRPIEGLFFREDVQEVFYL